MDKDLHDFFDQLDDSDKFGHATYNTQGSAAPVTRIRKKLEKEELGFIAEQDAARGTFQFTYHAARFESWWLLESLNEFYAHHWISDVLRRVKGGKEASVYQCKAGSAVNADLAAAKVYRPRSLRNLHNDILYREGRHDLDGDGRVIHDDRMLRAIQKKTAYGRELQHQSWVAYEFDSMQVLHAAGADVPEPYHMTNNSILMEYIGGPASSAPALNEVRPGRSEAYRLFERVMRNIDILLAHERIHGDLSAYNILYADGEIKLIDFPQVVSPKINRNAFVIFRRDVERVCDYFRSRGVSMDKEKLTEELWTSHGYSLPRQETDIED